MPRQLKPCGTTAAFRRHKRHGEDACAACTAAQAAYMKDYWRAYRRPSGRKTAKAGA